MSLVSAVSLTPAALVALQVSGLPTGSSQLLVTSVSGPGFGSRPGPINLVSFSASTSSTSVLVPLTRSTTDGQTGLVTLGFDIVLATSGRRCPGYTVSFTYSTPPPPVLPPIIPPTGPTTTPPVGR